MKEKFDLRVKETQTYCFGFEKSGQYFYKATPLGGYLVYKEDEVDIITVNGSPYFKSAASSNEERTSVTVDGILNAPIGSFALNDGGDCECETIIDWNYETFLMAKEWVKKGINEDVAIERAESFVNKFRKKYEE